MELKRVFVKILQAVERRDKNGVVGVLIDEPHIIAHKRKRVVVPTAHVRKPYTIANVKPVLRRNPHHPKVVLEDVVDHARRQFLARSVHNLALRGSIITKKQYFNNQQKG